MGKFCKKLSLAFLEPELSKEWDYEKNYPLVPDDIRRGSNKRVGWKCGLNKEHQWIETIYNRSNGYGCPYCSGRKVCRDNCLATKNPELASEWHHEKNYPLTPRYITQYSNKKVWWKCNKNHIYAAEINNRNRGSNCPYCSGQKACKDNCLATLNPELAKEWHPTKNGELTPHDVLPQSNKKVWWKCEKGHIYTARLPERYRGDGCPYCSGKRVCKDNCLATLNPYLAKEWHPIKNKTLTPNNITCGSNEAVWWKCKKCNHEWSSSPNNRNRGNGCPSCSKVKLKDGTICDSLSEAYYYLKLKNRKVKFEYHFKIGLGRCVCDFYIPSTNRYIEVTSYSKNFHHWGTYHKNILRKKNYITKNLKAKFKFVQIILTPQQTQYVRSNIV